MEVGVAAGEEADRVRIVQDHVVGVAEVPRQAVEVAEDVAGGARRLAVARRQDRVVEHRPSVLHARRLGIEHRQVRDLRRRRRVDHADRVVEAREDVQPAVAPRRARARSARRR